MNKNNKEFIPEITINNKGEEKIAVIDGVEQKVEVPAKEGFNIKTKNINGEYERQYFVKELEAVIILDRYEIQSKYGVKPMYMSNEFEFDGERNHLRVYCPEEKSVKYEGTYSGAKEFFSTGEETKAGTIGKTFDVFSILYLLIDNEIFKFRWKMNQNNNWFSYKQGCKTDKYSREDTKDYRGVKTKFNLEKKKFGSNEFWVCALQNIGENDRTKADKAGNELENKLDEIANSYKAVKKEEASEEINVKEIPF